MVKLLVQAADSHRTSPGPHPQPTLIQGGCWVRRGAKTHPAPRRRHLRASRGPLPSKGEARHPSRRVQGSLDARVRVCPCLSSGMPPLPQVAGGACGTCPTPGRGRRAAFPVPSMRARASPGALQRFQVHREPCWLPQATAYAVSGSGPGPAWSRGRSGTGRLGDPRSRSTAPPHAGSEHHGALPALPAATADAPT